MATTDLLAPGADEGGNGGDKPRGPAPVRTAGDGGFFTIYKKGHGYWTRMGTAVAVSFLGGLTAWEIYRAAPYLGGLNERRPLLLGIVALVFTAFMLFAWRIMNKPANADFLIATDGEMKKVNWTSRKDLIGSTKVVILFMFLIAAFLAIIDVVFSFLFEFIGVLRDAGTTIGGG